MHFFSVSFQISVLEVLTRYVRNQFTDPAPTVTTAVRLQAKQRGSTNAKSTTFHSTTSGSSKAKAASVSSTAGASAGTVISRRVVKKAFYSDEEDHSEEETIVVPDKDNKLEYNVFS